MHFLALTILISLSAPALALDKRGSDSSTLPIVNLGYENHQAISFNETTQIYNFSNIRYGQPPIGNLRWRAPLPVDGTSDVVNNGSVGKVCAQALGAWNAIAKDFSKQYFTTGNQTFDYAAALASLPNATILSGKALDGRTTEDCLFLDVFVPKGGIDDCEAAKLPVYVYFYGGGYTSGEKSEYDPSAIINQGNNSMIGVVINYRLGAFGWLAGPDVRQDGTLNAGLHDQRLALDWVQKYIHLFGGDATRVTLAGQSAGAGSIEHHLASYGGQGGPVPFAQTLAASPAFYPAPDLTQYFQAHQRFFAALNVTTLEQARQLPFEKVVLANLAVVWNSDYGSNSFGPVVDGTYVPALPGLAFLNGSFHKDVKVFTTHNTNEGFLFSSPLVNTSAAFAASVKGQFPFISNQALQYITQTLYPPVYDGSAGYTNDFERNVAMIQDSNFICNSNYIDRAYGNKTYSWQFAVPPALHGEDNNYIFPSQGPYALNPINETLATWMQQRYASFVITGKPAPDFPMYGAGADVLQLTDKGISETMDQAANKRCYWWQQAKYYYS